jgi:hypothetical protein
MLDALKKEHQSKYQPTGIAATFKAFWEGGAENV